MDSKPGFWTTLPGVLTGLAAVLSAAAGLFLAVRGGPAAPPVHKLATEEVAAAPAADAYPRRAVIDDPDGFTNVRAAPATSAAKLAAIGSGESFAVAPSAAAWWRVRTNAGVEGYVHRSRVRLVAG